MKSIIMIDTWQFNRYVSQKIYWKGGEKKAVKKTNFREYLFKMCLKCLVMNFLFTIKGVKE